MTLFRLHVVLLHIRPIIWRRIELSSHTSLRQLHSILQVSMGWNNNYTHGFEVNGSLLGRPSHKRGPAKRIGAESTVLLFKAFPFGKTTLVYWYDCGDDWKRELPLEADLPVTSTTFCLDRELRICHNHS